MGEQQVEKRQIYISDQMDKVEGKEDGKAGSLSIQADNQCNEYFFYGPHSFSWSVSVSRSQIAASPCYIGHSSRECDAVVKTFPSMCGGGK